MDESMTVIAFPVCFVLFFTLGKDKLILKKKGIVYQTHS